MILFGGFLILGVELFRSGSCALVFDLEFVSSVVGFCWCCVDKDNGPKTINSLQLINAGKILENHKTIADSRVPISELPGGAITMLAIVRPTLPEKSKGNYNNLCPVCFLYSVVYVFACLFHL